MQKSCFRLLFLVSISCIVLFKCKLDDGVSAEPPQNALQIVHELFADTTVFDSTELTFTVKAEGDSIRYQWFKNDTVINGANSAQYTIIAKMADNGSEYSCKVYNSFDSLFSVSAVLTVAEQSELPIITKQPSDTTIFDSTAAVFSIEAIGTGELSYQWQKNDENIEGANSAVYTTPVLRVSESGTTFQCVVTNNAGKVVTEKAVVVVKVSGSGEKLVKGDLSDLVVTEIMYHSYESSFSEESDEPGNFIEFHNKGTGSISLEGITTDGVDYNFPDGATIKAGEYLVIASNAAEFKNQYNFEPFGVYSKKLKNSGERLAFIDNSGNEIIAIDYMTAEPWPVEADGNGYSLVPVSEETYSDYSNGALWRKSFALYGSPGKADPAPVYINEIIAHTDVYGDAIELYNPNNIEVNISGWYLSDDQGFQKYKIPDAKGNIAADGYMVFYASDFNQRNDGNAFGLSEDGETVYLYDADRQLVDSIAFEATDNEVSFGRYKNSAGAFVHAMLEKSTLGAANSGPVLSSAMVITEIMYNPMPETNPEYIEMKNISDQTVNLWYADPETGDDYPDKTWKIGGFGADFPQSTSVKPGEIIIVTNNTATEATFRAAYTGVPDSVKIFCIGEKALSNGGERIAIMASVKPNPEEPSKTYHKEIEAVEYRDEGGWSDLADGQGSSLVRKNDKTFANDPTNWDVAATPNPGL